MQTIPEMKQSIIDYLKSKPEFSTYDFTSESGGINLLMEMLAKSSYDVDISNSLVINETFVDTLTTDTAIFRKASEIGYDISNRISSRVTVEVEALSSINISIPKYTKFESSNGEHQFVTTEDYVLVSDGTKVSGEMFLTQGLVYNYSEDIYKANQIIRLPNTNIDSSYFEVKLVRDNLSKTLIKNETVLYDTGAYYRQIVDDGFIEIYGSDNYFNIGDQISTNYLISNGLTANNLTEFVILDDLGLNEVVVTAVGSSFGGQDEVDIEAEKINIKNFYRAQNRAVTTSDYKVILIHNFPYFEEVFVYGGEDAYPKYYNKTYITIDLGDGYLTDKLKADIKALLAKYNIVNISVEVAQSSKMFFDIVSQVYTDADTVIGNEITAKVRTITENYFDDITDIFSTSALESLINSDEAVDSNYLTFEAYKEINPENAAVFFLDYGNKLLTFKTSLFLYDNAYHYLEKVDSTVNLYKATAGGLLIRSDVGTVNEDGIITINNVEINEIIRGVVIFEEQDIKRKRDNIIKLNTLDTTISRL